VTVRTAFEEASQLFLGRQLGSGEGFQEIVNLRYLLIVLPGVRSLPQSSSTEDPAFQAAFERQHP
jgi:hypothetical protein